MAMKICKECGAEVSKSAKVCPKCGKKLKHTGLIVFIVIIVIFICLGAIISSNNNTTTTSTTTQTGTNVVQTQKEETSEEDTSGKATLEKFNKIETGMTYQQVVDIMGAEGTLSTESSFGNQSMQIYYWYASNGISNATISFMNGEVSGKTQIGLK